VLKRESLGTRVDYRSELQEWTKRLDYRTGPQDWTTGLDYGTGLQESMIILLARRGQILT